MNRKTSSAISAAKSAILALAEIKAVTEAFDRGESNVLDALDAITMAVEEYRTNAQSERDAA